MIIHRTHGEKVRFAGWTFLWRKVLQPRVDATPVEYCNFRGNFGKNRAKVGRPKACMSLKLTPQVLHRQNYGDPTHSASKKTARPREFCNIKAPSPWAPYSNRTLRVLDGRRWGLSAAFEHQSVGYEVTVFEAQGEVGGRVKSRHDIVTDRTMEEGGESIGRAAAMEGSVEVSPISPRK